MMQTNRFNYANLDEAGLKKVQTLEEQVDSVILVMERQLPIAKLSDQQVDQIHTLEKELGVVLVAYRA
jgi:hypothetical protein